MDPSHDDLIRLICMAVDEKLTLAEGLGALATDSYENIGLSLVGPAAELSLWHDPREQPRRFRLYPPEEAGRHTEWLLNFPWDGHPKLPPRLTNRYHEPIPYQQTAQLFELLSGMEVTIESGGWYGLIGDEGKIVAICPRDALRSAAFQNSNPHIYVLEGVTIPGISNEPDHMQRLRAFWQLHQQGRAVNTHAEPFRYFLPRQFFCGGGGRSWLEYYPGRGETSPLYVLGAPYIEYSVAPFVPVASDKTYRDEV